MEFNYPAHELSTHFPARLPFNVAVIPRLFPFLCSPGLPHFRADSRVAPVRSASRRPGGRGPGGFQCDTRSRGFRKRPAKFEADAPSRNGSCYALAGISRPADVPVLRNTCSLWEKRRLSSSAERTSLYVTSVVRTSFIYSTGESDFLPSPFKFGGRCCPSK